MMLPDWFSLRWKAPSPVGAGLPALSWGSTGRLGCLPAQRRQAGLEHRQAGAYRSWRTTAGAADDPKLAATC